MAKRRTNGETATLLVTKKSVCLLSLGDRRSPHGTCLALGTEPSAGVCCALTLSSMNRRLHCLVVLTPFLLGSPSYLDHSKLQEKALLDTLFKWYFMYGQQTLRNRLPENEYI